MTQWPARLARVGVSPLLAILLAEALPASAGALHYNADIRPILSDRCFTCHGPDQRGRKAKLRLDDPDSAFGPREDPAEHAIVPGQPDKSLLIRRIFATNEDDLMPPPASHLTLNEAEKERLRTWIAAGAKYEPHWAFVPLPASIPVPSVNNLAWPRNDIDKFILNHLEKAGLRPSPEAGKIRWLRRVTFDLNGLPPTSEDIDSFLADQSATAYERVVDRLLAAKAFGERMAVPWLDGARYADSYGYQSDLLCPTWPYRDWVVDAFNRNLPYDQFLTEQLAGDLLPHPARQQRLATAFNRLHRQTNEGGSVEEEWRNEYVSDRVHTFGSVFLGLTLECARCHDHKFDPVTQRDYYSFSAFFNSIDEYGTYDDTRHVPTPSILLPTPKEEQEMIATAGEVQNNRQNLVQAAAAAESSLRKWLSQSNHEAVLPGLIAHFTFDALSNSNRFNNELNASNTTSLLPGNTRVQGRLGQAVRFSGDDPMTFTSIMNSMEAWDRYALVFWLNLPVGLTNGVVFHSTEGSDTSFRGTELSLQEGKLFFVIKRFWPGNALAIQTTSPIPPGSWLHIAVNYDGSGDAAGMQIFVNGKPAATEILRNRLYKSPETGNPGIAFGARSRSAGLKGAALDDLRVYGRPLAPIEVAQLFDGHSLTDAFAAGSIDKLRPYYLAAISDAMARAWNDLAQANKRFFQVRNPIQETSVMEELPAPRACFLLARGRYDAPKTDAARVGRTTPSFLPPFPSSAPRNRLGLAQWLTQPDHPLTARVAVNRHWQMLFGRGLVASPENFGSQGALPTHPELLDWLARDYINSGWNTKALLRKMVLSATYRQDSSLRQELFQKDPENLLLARGPSQRLPAEMIRDAALAASGLLDLKLGGPPVSPYMPGDLWRESNQMSPAYQQSVGSDLYRRSLYTVWKRTAPMPNMLAFDAPSREVCLLKRIPTGTPQQAFVLLNDTQFVEAARVLAEQTLTKGGPGTGQRIDYAFRRLTGRYPEPQEARLLTDLLVEGTSLFAREPERALRLITVGDRKPDASLNPAELAAATEMTQAMLNLDATVWNR